MAIRSHRDLLAWQKGFAFAIRVYRMTEHHPSDERFTLISQLGRAAVSVPSNIAEGYGRHSTKEYVRFLKISRGRLYEIDTRLLFCVELGYITEAQYDSLYRDLQECTMILAGLLRSI